MAATTLVYIQNRGFHLRGLVGGIAVGGCCAAAIFSTPWLHLDGPFRAALIGAAWTSFIVGTALRFWSTLYVGGRKVGGRRESVLVVDGPYSIVRNPLYLGSLLVGLSAALLLQSVTVVAAILAAAVHYVLVTIPAEEVFLRENVGAEAFDAYAARTPRLWPNLGLYHAPGEVTLYTKALRNEARRMSRMLVAAVLLTIVAAARCEAWWPAWFTLP
jgi:protein-S-isoprenylcysteine O-methyltransferase Ste14